MSRTKQGYKLHDVSLIRQLLMTTKATTRCRAGVFRWSYKALSVVGYQSYASNISQRVLASFLKLKVGERLELP